jgi:methylmalonyl-CoA/ethylmalonyl-CoA epimerase
MPLVQSGEYTGGRYAYVDTHRDPKVLIELLEND